MNTQQQYIQQLVTNEWKAVFQNEDVRRQLTLSIIEGSTLVEDLAQLEELLSRILQANHKGYVQHARNLLYAYAVVKRKVLQSLESYDHRYFEENS